MKQPKTIQIEEIIWPKRWENLTVPPTPWVMPGRYEVVREFDEEHYIIRLSKNIIAIIEKHLTKTIA